MRKIAAIAILVFITVGFAYTKTDAKTVKNRCFISNYEEKEGKNAKPIHLTNEAFKKKVFNYEKNREWKYEGDLPCIIDFYAAWCGPCRKVAPILDELAVQYDKKIVIYKVDTDKEKELAAAFRISSIPALLFVPAKGQPQMAKGALSKEQFIKIIEAVLLENN